MLATALCRGWGWDVAWGGVRGSPWQAAVPWNRTSERVRIPSLACRAAEPTRALPRVELFGIAALPGGTVHLQLHTPRVLISTGKENNYDFLSNGE